MTNSQLSSHKIKEEKKERLPIFSLVLLGLALLSLFLVIIARKNVRFAIFFNRRISAAVRALLASATNIVPFSLAELLILLIPVIILLLIAYAIRSQTKTAPEWVLFLFVHRKGRIRRARE